MDISTKKKQAALKPRNEPYWMKLSKGRYLGYRSPGGTWVARYRAGDKQHYQALHAEGFDDAKAKAEAWFRSMGASTTRRGTVREALEAYLEWLRDQGRESAAKTNEDRFKLIVWNDPIADIKLHELRRDTFKDWRNRLRKGRKNRSVNRHVRSIVAGLNRAVTEGFAGDREAWRLDPLADDVEDASETAVFLNPKQRAAIIKAGNPAIALFLRGLELTGARPKELAAARVRDLEGDIVRLAHHKGRPPRLKVRAVVLSDPEFFKAQAKGKLPGAYLFTDMQGNPWTRFSWARDTREAIAAAKGRIPPGASAYSFRHARISELLQVHHIDPLTVAAQTGTSVKVIERSYFQFIPSAMREALRAAR